jgi:plasmid segregation protein ParM
MKRDLSVAATGEEWRAAASDTVRVGARAVDVGYFSTKFTLGRAGDTISTRLFPSVAPRVQRGGMDSAGAARADGWYSEIAGANYFAGSGVEAMTTGTEPRVVSPDYCLTSEYRALLNAALSYMAVEAGATRRLVIESLVVGLPLNTFLQHAGPLRESVLGERRVISSAGAAMEVAVEGVQVVVQPQGAMMNYSVGPAAFRGKTLVIDPGGGTLDWFFAEGRVPNWQRSGAHPSSMLACAYAVADCIRPDWRDSIHIVNRIDEAIRADAPSFKVGARTYSLAEHRGAIDAVLEQSISKMLAGVGRWEEIDQVLVTGGGAGVVLRHLQRFYPEHVDVVHVDADPVFSNVRGFQIAAEILHASRAGMGGRHARA